MLPRVTALATILATFSMPALAQHPTWYDELKVPKTGGSCCSGKDCAPAEPCLAVGDKEGLIVAGACYPIPWDRVLNIPSPDGQSHACFFQGRIQCVVLSGGS